MDVVERYLRLGLEIGRHVDGFVDAYYGPAELAGQAASRPPRAPSELAESARRLLADIDSGTFSGPGESGADDIDPARRQWIRAQVRGLHTTARKLTGEQIAYLDEIEACYGVRPAWVDEDEFADAHRRLEQVLPKGPGSLAERYTEWRESQVVPAATLRDAVHSLAEDFRERTAAQFGLPEGEAVEFVLERDKPWSGFNYYLGTLRSRVAINTDLPVLSPRIAHLVAHEAYPGHHTEHCRKEFGLVRRQRRLEQSIFLVGTPQCLISEGLADLALEVIAGPRPETVVEEHLRVLRIPYDATTAAEVAEAAAKLAAVGGNAAIGLHDLRWTADQASGYLERWALLTEKRAAKRLEFLTSATWRAYEFCYIDGYRLCRRYVGGDPSRFERLVTEQLVPSELVAA